MSARMPGVRLAYAAAVAAAALALTACSGSSAPRATPSPTPSSTSAPTTSAAPTPTPTSSAPVSSSSSAAPLSAFESDPAVQAFRAWAVQAAKTINSGHDDSAALQALMTPAFTKYMGTVLGPEVGKYYPGPVPFQPLKVTAASSSQRDIYGCLFDGGFALSKKTGKPADAKDILAVEIPVVHQSGKWLIDSLTKTTSVSCSGITVRTQKW